MVLNSGTSFSLGIQGLGGEKSQHAVPRGSLLWSSARVKGSKKRLRASRIAKKQEYGDNDEEKEGEEEKKKREKKWPFRTDAPWDMTSADS